MAIPKRFLSSFVAAALIVAAFAHTSTALPLTRQQALGALLAPASGVVIDTTEAAVWSPFRDYGFGAGFEGLLATGFMVNPYILGHLPHPGPGMTASTPSYFFWIDDDPLARFQHSVRFVLVHSGVVSPTVGNGGIEVTSQGWWPILTRPGPVSDTLYSTVNRRASDLPADYTNPDGLVAGHTWHIAEVTVPPGPSPERLGAPRSVQAGNPCGIVIQGASGSDFDNDGNKYENDLKGHYGVPAGRIKRAGGAAGAAKIADVGKVMRDLCTQAPPCDKIFVRIVSHGNDKSIVMGDGDMTAAALCESLMILSGKKVPICLIVDACRSGSLMDPKNWGFPGGSSVITSTDSSHDGYGGPATEPGGGEIDESFFGHALSACLNDPRADSDGKNGVSDQEALEWVKKNHPCYSSHRTHKMRYPAGPPAGAEPNPGPTGTRVFRFTAAGQEFPFFVPPGTGSVCITFEASTNPATCANASVYCKNASGEWVLTKHWNWNAGLTRYFTPGVSGGEYKLVIHSNNYPVGGGIRYLDQAVPETPNSQLTLPMYSVGWQDLSGGEFNPILGQGGGPTVFQNMVPGLDLANVPNFIGANHSNGIAISMPLQPDFSRPFLYQGGNPNSNFLGSTYLLLSADNIMDALGQPTSFLPLQVTLFQGITTRQFSLQATRQLDGSIQIPRLDMGSIRAQPFGVQVTVGQAFSAKPGGVLPPAGILSLDAFVVVTATFGTSNVEGQFPGMPAYSLSRATPNPSRGGTRMLLELSVSEPVRARVYDAGGRLVRTVLDERMEPGLHNIVWDGRTRAGGLAPSGVYFVRVELAGSVETRRVALVR